MNRNAAAFPLYIPTAQRGDASEVNEGMTMRDYFAARAPIDIPDWFKHVEPAKTFPPMPEAHELDETHWKLATDWRRDGCFDLPEEISWWGEKVIAYRTARAEWEDLNRRARFIQWRYAYADIMLEQRGQS